MSVSAIKSRNSGGKDTVEYTTKEKHTSSLKGAQCHGTLSHLDHKQNYLQIHLCPGLNASIVQLVLHIW